VVWPIIAIGYYVAQILDTMVPESAKAGWPKGIRLAWDWILTNVGHSANDGSEEATTRHAREVSQAPRVVYVERPQALPRPNVGPVLDPELPADLG